MQLLICIVQAEDADILVDRLVKRGIRVTRLNSMGSLLARGNATILIGVESNQIDMVFDILRATCNTRRAFLNALPQIEAPHASLAVVMPLEVTIGGAIVFSFPVSRFVRIRGGSTPPATDQTYASTSDHVSDGGKPQMKLILAIIHNDDADPVSGGLLAAGYRVTRLNTAGGFFRRGNVTFLIGVEASQVDDVLKIIQANCRVRGEAGPVESGMPSYGATAFVLEADRFARM